MQYNQNINYQHINQFPAHIESNLIISQQNKASKIYERCGLANGEKFNCSSEFTVQNISSFGQIISIDGINFIIKKNEGQVIEFQGIKYFKKPSISLKYVPELNKTNPNLKGKKISLFIRNITTTTPRQENARSNSEGDESNGSGDAMITSKPVSTHIKSSGLLDKIIFGYRFD
jgi:hypothetical protein